MELVLDLLLGWLLFLPSVAPRVHIDPGSVFLGLVCASGLAMGFHSFLEWLSHSMGGREWKGRWTLSSLGMIIFSFTAGISAVAIIHQMIWLFMG
jgi:hypothetical protein